MFNSLYNYAAKVERIIDGDTIYVTADLGFGVSKFLKLRLDSINTPEIRGDEREEGLKAKAFVESLIAPGDQVYIESYKDGGFGRYAAKVWYSNEESLWVSLNDHLVDSGFAEVVS